MFKFHDDNEMNRTIAAILLAPFVPMFIAILLEFCSYGLNEYRAWNEEKEFREAIARPSELKAEIEQYRKMTAFWLQDVEQEWKEMMADGRPVISAFGNRGYAMARDYYRNAWFSMERAVKEHNQYVNQAFSLILGSPVSAGLYAKNEFPAPEELIKFLVQKQKKEVS